MISRDIDGAPSVAGRAVDALMVLPPDFHAPEMHLALRFPPLGPAVVAACTAELGIRFRAVDLVLEQRRRPLEHDPAPLRDPARVEACLAGASDPAIEAVVDELVRRIESTADRASLVAISVDRASQTSLAALLSVELKRRWCARVIVGGVSMQNLRALFARTGAEGADIVTTASTPRQIARAFTALRGLAHDRRGPPIEPNEELVQLVRGGMRAAPSAEGWPLPDFSLYELAQYRRDPLAAEHSESARVPALGASLALPYFSTFECQFSCAFCQTGGTQEAKPANQVVRELAALSELWDVGEFLFFDTQINLHAEALSRELLAAKLDLRWSDSLRVRPLSPGLLEQMARAGCASITVGVESASERVLKAMVKGHRPEHASQMIHEAHACEMLLRVNILTCFPGETRDDLQQTCAFVREHAFAIDDLAPSSFYLTSDSPIGRRPERYGIVLRGPRELRGDHRFRKSPDSLQYDEIGGYSWEERQPMLDESESLVRSAWRDGREGVGFTGSLGPTTMLALRRRCATKREIVELLRGEPRATRTVACDVVPREPLVAKLIAPSHPSPALERVFELAADRLRFAAAARLSHGSTAHVVLFPDGVSYFFRGSVARGAGGRPRSIAIEETLAAPDGGVADDLRGRALRPGIRLDGARIAAALGAFALLSFRMERAAATDDEEAT